MKIENVEVGVCCHSKKEGVSISCTFNIASLDSCNESETIEMIYFGLSEAFWENHFEFASGIEKAKQFLASTPGLTSKLALFEVFGHFDITYETDGEKIDLGLNINADPFIYELLDTK